MTDMKLITTIILLPVFFVLHINLCKASDTLRKKKPVTAVLVELKEQDNRLSEAQKAHDSKRINELIKDRDNVTKALKADFKDHFDYCKVYYFSDTNYERIKAHQFKGILIDEDGSPASNTNSVESGSRYLVITFGKPEFQAGKQKEVTPQDASSNTYASDMPDIFSSMIVRNEALNQIAYYYQMDYQTPFTIGKKYRKYYYKSKHFKIEYFPNAGLLNDELHRHPYK